MNKALSIAFLVVGIVLLVLGYNASQSVSSGISEAVQGAPSNKAIWLISLGVVAALVGGFGLIPRRRG
ncbi:membrane protein [Opitutaceae bacterium TAV5]|nr:membrane protein [Opitutaceae bacterium TAV5]